MALADQKTTVEAFEAFINQHPDRLFELIEGEIVEKMPTEQHGTIALNIGSEIRFYLKKNPIGIAGVEIRHRNPDDSYNDRLPDVSFRRTTSDDLVTEVAVPQMPDLAVEVKSMSDTYKLMRDKAQYYLDNGTLLVWLVYPEKKLIEVYRQDEIDILTADDTLSGYDILPDFKVRVDEIFP